MKHGGITPSSTILTVGEAVKCLYCLAVKPAYAITINFGFGNAQRQPRPLRACSFISQARLPVNNDMFDLSNERVENAFLPD